MTSHVTSAGEMVDEICHRHYGFTGGAVEAVLSANPGLAKAEMANGFELPAGIVIELPVLLNPTEPLPNIGLFL